MGDVPVQLTAHERADREMAIYSRVWDGRRYSQKRFLHAGIRDAQGKVITDAEQAAQKAALERQRAVAAGLTDEDAGPLTLGQGFRRMLHEREGKYAADSEWKREVTRAAEVAVEVLGAELLWSQVRHAHYRKLWRFMAHEHARTGRYGPRAAEVIVGAVVTCARWLQQEGALAPGSALPAPTWRQALKADWAQITDTPPAEPATPRYTVEEQRRLFGALPKADPRLLVLEIGAELRLGQVLRARRSDIEPHGGFRIGAVRIHGRGKKFGERIVLTMQQRHALTRALIRGYLAELEELRRDFPHADYYLFPGGRLHRDGDVLRPHVQQGDAHWTRWGLRSAWKELEKLAGVEHVEGRSWYGVRRLQTDLAEDHTDDARVLNRLGGWKRTSTREHYQERGRTDIAEQAADLRAKIRPKLPQKVTPVSNRGETERRQSGSN